MGTVQIRNGNNIMNVKEGSAAHQNWQRNNPSAIISSGSSSSASSGSSSNRSTGSSSSSYGGGGSSSGSSSSSARPSTAGLSSSTLAEIQRKASQGIALVNPTAQKSAIYNSYLGKATSPSTSSGKAAPKPLAPSTGGGGFTSAQRSEIQRKASLGQPLVKPTQAKLNLYNSFAPQSSNNAQSNTKLSNNGITQAQLAEIQRKASLGQPLVNPTQAKQAVYNSYLPQGPIAEQSFQTEDSVQGLLDENTAYFQDQMDAQNQYFNEIIANLQDSIAAQQPQQDPAQQEYQATIEQMQQQYEQLMQQLQYFQLLQQYYNMYGQGGGMGMGMVNGMGVGNPFI